MTRTVSLAALAAFLVASSGPARDAGAAFTRTYLSLGDSIAFGETAFSADPALGPYADPSNGDRGFVGMYADYLGKLAGARPNVVNLAVDGETSASFSSGVGRVPPGVNISDAALAELNTRYTGAVPPTQSALLTSTLASEAAAGRAITDVTISLGSNDLFGLALTDPSAVADLPAALARFRANDESLLKVLRASLPAANIELIGTYNPFTATPSSPFAPLAALAIPLLNQQIRAVAAEYGAGYVNLYDTPLTTDAADYTLILNQGDVHPAFDKGYAVIAAQLEAVPEPSSILLLALGLAGLAARGLRPRGR